MTLPSIAVLLLVSAVVAMLSRRLHLPYAVGLVLAGIWLAFIPALAGLQLSKELIYNVLLPALIFEAAVQIRWSELRLDLPAIAIFATVGVAITAATAAIGMVWLAGWTLAPALVFGVLIAATDPVSVIATFKEARVTGRLRLLVEAESIINDGTATVGLSVAVALALGHSMDLSQIGIALVIAPVGGALCGGIVAGAVLLLAGRTQDYLVEITLSTVAAYGSFMLAEYLGMSAVLATLVAGLIIGNAGSLGPMTAKGRETLDAFWEVLAFVANSLIFLLIGVQQWHVNVLQQWWLVAAAISVVLIGRAFSIYPLSALLSRTRWYIEPESRHILFWGGLRGALGLALALGLPDDLAHRSEIITVTFGVVLFSIFVQGLTITPLLRRFGVIGR